MRRIYLVSSQHLENNVPSCVFEAYRFTNSTRNLASCTKRLWCPWYRQPDFSPHQNFFRRQTRLSVSSSLQVVDEQKTYQYFLLWLGHEADLQRKKSLVLVWDFFRCVYT